MYAIYIHPAPIQGLHGHVNILVEQTVTAEGSEDTGRQAAGMQSSIAVCFHFAQPHHQHQQVMQEQEQKLVQP